MRGQRAQPALLDVVEHGGAPRDTARGAPHKPRGQWHTFWNAGDEPASCLELISPAGLEQLFRTFATLTEPPTPEQMVELAAPYHCDIDLEATFPVVQRHGLAF